MFASHVKSPGFNPPQLQDLSEAISSKYVYLYVNILKESRISVSLPNMSLLCIFDFRWSLSSFGSSDGRAVDCRCLRVLRSVGRRFNSGPKESQVLSVSFSLYKR